VECFLLKRAREGKGSGGPAHESFARTVEHRRRPDGGRCASRQTGVPVSAASILSGWFDHPAALPFSLGLLGALMFVWRSYLLLGQGRRDLEHKSQEHHSLFVNNVDAVIGIDPQGRITGANTAAAQLTQRPVTALIDREFTSLISSVARQKVHRAIAAALTGRQSTVETEMPREDEENSVVDLTSVPIIVKNNVVGVYAILRDTTERKRLQRELEDRALHDYLTGLPNRALFADRLMHALRRGRRDGERMALLYVDLDRFKPVNDRAGHKVGDQLLCEVARRLQSLVRDGDTVARVGGDEFAVLLETVESERQAVTAAERIVTLIRTPIVADGEELQVGASVGIAVSSENTGDPEELVHQADLAMYEAKRRGGFQFKLYSQELEQEGSDWAIRLEGDLRRAIDRDELELKYQPIVEMSGERIVGLEALARWRHPEFGPLMPSSFIPLAEKSSLIAELDRWVLERSCREIRRLIEFGLAEPPFCLSVNLSARHFQEPDFLSAVADILLRTNFDPDYLQLEITESSAGGDQEKVRGLKELGVKVAIDDFGTGFSSLSYLRDLDVDVLKVDKSFVLALGADPASVAIVRTILTLAEMLDLEVIVEGIEDPVQLSHLEDLGGTLVQGFLFGRPVDAAALPKMLSKGVLRAGADQVTDPDEPILTYDPGPAVPAGIPAAPRKWTR